MTVSCRADYKCCICLPSLNFNTLFAEYMCPCSSRFQKSVTHSPTHSFYCLLPTKAFFPYIIPKSDRNFFLKFHYYFDFMMLERIQLDKVLCRLKRKTKQDCWHAEQEAFHGLSIQSGINLSPRSSVIFFQTFFENS